MRFIFILLGPRTYELDYKEAGRSIGTLMSNRVSPVVLPSCGLGLKLENK